MIEPLITQEDIEDSVYGVLVDRISDMEGKTTLHLPIAEAVYGLLRRELTPEVLQTIGEWEMERDGVRWARVTTPDDLHRRIFGEDE